MQSMWKMSGPSLARLVIQRMKELGRSREEVSSSVGISTTKFEQKLEKVRSGHYEGFRFLRSLAKVGILDQELVAPPPFSPNAFILTDKERPSPIFVATMSGSTAWKRVDLKGVNPILYVEKVLGEIRPGYPGYGWPTGFVIHYTEDYSVEFDLNGHPVRTGTKTPDIMTVGIRIPGICSA